MESNGNSVKIALFDKIVSTWNRASMLEKSILVSPILASVLFIFSIARMKLGFISLIAALVLSIAYIIVKDGILSPLKAIPNTLFSIGVLAGAIWEAALTRRITIVLFFGILMLMLAVAHWIVIFDTTKKQIFRTALLYLFLANSFFAIVVMFAYIGAGSRFFIFGLASFAYLYGQTMLFLIALPVKKSNALSFVSIFRNMLIEKAKAQKEKEKEDRIRFEQEKKRRLANEDGTRSELSQDEVSTHQSEEPEESERPKPVNSHKPVMESEPGQDYALADDLSKDDNYFDLLLDELDFTTNTENDY